MPVSYFFESTNVYVNNFYTNRQGGIVFIILATLTERSPSLGSAALWTVEFVNTH